MSMAAVCHNPGPPIFIGINRAEVKYPFFKAPDFNSFMFLFFDNLSSLLAILLALSYDIPRITRSCWGPFMDCWETEAPYIAAWEDVVWFKITPGIGFAIAFGNLYYAWMAYKLAGYEKRVDVTALPYGINTPAGFLTAYNIMLPVLFYYRFDSPTTDPVMWADQGWKAGVAACFTGGCFEIAGAWLGPILATIFTRAALYCPISCVGFVWLGLNPFIGLMAEPIKAAMPIALAFVGFYANRGKGLPFLGVPVFQQMTFPFILFFGCLTFWLGLGKFDATVPELWAVVEARAGYAFKNQMAPFVGLAGFGVNGVTKALTIVLPVSLAAFIETMENVELAAQKGDQYNMREAMICDGIGSCVGAIFGSIVPTTCYIGHSRHKAIGATSGYSVVNGLTYFFLCMTGLLPVLAALVDPTAVATSLVIVGLMIVQDAVELTHPRHIPAYCCGLFFVIADPWNFDLRDVTTAYCTRSADRMHGLKNMFPGGGIFCSLMTTQVLCDLSDAKFFKCAMFSAASVILCLFGLMHGNNPVEVGGGLLHFGHAGEGELTVAYMDGTYKTGLNEGYRFCIMYFIIFCYCMVHAGIQKMSPDNLKIVEGLGFCPSKEDPDGKIKKSPPWYPDDMIATSAAVDKTAEA